jgi:hypothetical protein
VFALVKASSLVDAHPASQAGGVGQLLQAGVQIAGAVGGAGGARRALGAGVMADKDVMLECRQSSSWWKGRLSVEDSHPGRKKQARGAQAVSRVPVAPAFEALRSAVSHNHRRAPARICENKSLTMSTDNLLALKDDMVAFIEGHGLHRLPGYVTEDIPSIVWEGQGNADSWKDFVEMAKHVGAPFVTFSEMTLEPEELEALIEDAGEMNFPDEEAGELVEAQLLRKYTGMLGYIQLGFVYQGLVFLHETTTEWYERFQMLLEDIESFEDIVIDDHDHGDEGE